MTDWKRPRVIYIAGYGRSGSTVLDISLGEHPEIFGAGEITALTRHVWSQNEYCSCGSRIQECALWSDVIQRWLQGKDSSSIKRYKVLQKKYEWIASPLVIPARVDSRREFGEYADHTLRLFDAITSVSGKNTIIDSSKLPGRAFALSRIKGIDLHVIHLVRDGRAVAWSMLQKYERDLRAGLQKNIEPKAAMRTALRWGLVNFVAERVCRRLGTDQFTRVRYEDFAAEPDIAFQRIGKALCIDLSHVGKALKQGNTVRPGHQMAGSRVRMKGELRLIQDNSWRMRMPAGNQAVVRRLCGPLLRRFGYL